MDRDYFRYEDYGRSRRKKSNVFGWTIAILLLTGFAFAAWLGSFYISASRSGPTTQKPQETPKRSSGQALRINRGGRGILARSRFRSLHCVSPTERPSPNGEWRELIRITKGARLLPTWGVSYPEARGLTPNDIFTTGMVAMTNAVDTAAVMEHVYPGRSAGLPLMKQTLGRGWEIKLERRMTSGSSMPSAFPMAAS